MSHRSITPARNPKRTARRVAAVTVAAGLGAGFVAAQPSSAATASSSSTATKATAASTGLNTGGKLLVGVRSKNFEKANSTLGPIAVTRKYYSKLPAKYKQNYPSNVTVIISYVTSSLTNTASYAKSIPSGAKVELVYHHEPEGNHGDYPGDPKTSGAKFVSEFDAQAKVIHANSKVPVGFIAGGYQYRNGGRGAQGYFIPTQADDYYMDSYAQNNALVPSSQNQTVKNYIALLKARGHSFAGFSEYARGTASANSAARIKVLNADNTWLRSIGAKIWVYWWAPSPQTGANWQFTDAATIAAWKKIASQ